MDVLYQNKNSKIICSDRKEISAVMELQYEFIQKLRKRSALENSEKRTELKLSKGQKQLAKYIEEHYDKAAFFTAAKLGKAVGVSESTVVRFAIQLGYAGYPEFQQALEEYVRHKLNSIQRIEIASGTLIQTDILDSVLESDAEKIKRTKETIDKDAFSQAVNTLLTARSIYIIGIRSCAPLASFLGYYLNLIFQDVKILNTSNSSGLFEQMIHIQENDAVIGISFPRYSMNTLKAMEFAQKQNAKVIAITDSKNSPMAQYSSCNLLAQSDMASMVDSLVAPLSLINALIVALCMKRQKDVVQTLANLEKIWDEYQVYDKAEIRKIHPSEKENE